MIINADRFFVINAFKLKHMILSGMPSMVVKI